MRLTDEFKEGPTGLFHLEIFRRGELIEVFEEKNLIVVGSKITHARLLGGDVANRSIGKIGFGSSGTAPANGNTVLTNPFVKAIASVAYPADNQAQFNFSLGVNEANGLQIMEFGLITVGNLLYARKVRSAALPKDTDISLAGSWTISF